jgi:hypothetical protein
MRIAKFTGRVLPALALGLGTAAAGDPIIPPKPVEPFETPPVVVSQSATNSQDPSKAPTLAPPSPAPPKTYQIPIEPGPAPKELGKSPSVGDVNPPPMPLPEGAEISSPESVFAAMIPTQPGLSYARAEYLFWYLSGGNLPVLARTGPATAPIGVPGFPGETPLFGGYRPLGDPRSGVRLTFGTWLDNTRTYGVEVSGFWLDGQGVGFTDGSADGSRVVASSPFIDPTTGQASSVLISFPGVTAGSVHIGYSGRSIWGVEGVIRALLTAGPHWRLDGLVGVRCINYNEELTINETIAPLGPLFVPGSTLVSSETIKTENEFNGAVIGFDLQKDHGGWTFNVRPTVAIGRMRNTTIRDGVTVISVPGTPDLVLPGGTYNLTSNLGEVDSQDWTVIPQIDLRVSKTIWECVRLSVGYSALYIPLLARAGEQIDPFVNPNLLPPILPGGPPSPSPILERSPAWLQGFTVGFEVRF